MPGIASTVSEECTRPAASKSGICALVPNWSLCVGSETSIGNGRPIQVQAFPCFSRYWLMAFLKLPSLGFLTSLQAVRETTHARKIRENLHIRHPPEQLIDQTWSIGCEVLVDFDFES